MFSKVMTQLQSAKVMNYPLLTNCPLVQFPIQNGYRSTNFRKKSIDEVVYI